MSIFGNRVIDIVRKLMRPRIVKTPNATTAGMGLRIDQAETLRRMSVAALAVGRRGRFGRRTHPVARPQESRRARNYAFAALDARLDFHPAAVGDARLHLPHLDL